MDTTSETLTSCVLPFRYISYYDLVFDHTEYAAPEEHEGT